MHRKLFFLFALPLFFSACGVMPYTQVTQVTVSYNPKSYFKTDSSTILIVNEADTSQWRSFSAKKQAVFRFAVIGSLQYAYTALSTLPHVRVVKNSDLLGFATHKDSVQVLAKKFNADYVLVLKSLTASIPLDNVDNGTAYYKTNVSVAYLLYEANGIYFKKLNGDVSEANSEQPYNGVFASLIIHPTINGNAPLIQTAARHATQNALQDYLPYSITNNRRLYTDAYLQPALQKILTKDFENAEKLLDTIVKSPEPEKASKAAYNLAVVYEAEGDIEDAISLAQLSIDKMKNEYAYSLLTDLNNE